MPKTRAIIVDINNAVYAGLDQKKAEIYFTEHRDKFIIPESDYEELRREGAHEILLFAFLDSVTDGDLEKYPKDVAKANEQFLDKMTRAFSSKMTIFAASNRPKAKLKKEIVRVDEYETIDDLFADYAKTPFIKELNKLKKVAKSGITIVIYGKPGTGKSRIGEIIHEFSGREGVFYSHNCNDAPMCISQEGLFGHIKGAHSGAEEEKQGLLIRLKEGTFLLEELQAMPKGYENALLTVFSEKCVVPYGSSVKIPINMRVVVTTTKEMCDLVSEGVITPAFNDRLRKYMITMPNIESCPDMVFRLVVKFIKKYRKINNKPIVGIERDAIEFLKSLRGYGQIRGLEGIIEYTIVETEGSIIKCRTIEEHVGKDKLIKRVGEEAGDNDFVEMGYRRTHGNAKNLWIPRKVFDEIEEKYGSAGDEDRVADEDVVTINKSDQSNKISDGDIVDEIEIREGTSKSAVIGMFFRAMNNFCKNQTELAKKLDATKSRTSRILNVSNPRDTEEKSCNEEDEVIGKIVLRSDTTEKEVLAEYVEILKTHYSDQGMSNSKVAEKMGISKRSLYRILDQLKQSDN